MPEIKKTDNESNSETWENVQFQGVTTEFILEFGDDLKKKLDYELERLQDDFSASLEVKKNNSEVLHEILINVISILESIRIGQEYDSVHSMQFLTDALANVKSSSLGARLENPHDVDISHPDYHEYEQYGYEKFKFYPECYEDDMDSLQVMVSKAKTKKKAKGKPKKLEDKRKQSNQGVQLVSPENNAPPQVQTQNDPAIIVRANE